MKPSIRSYTPFLDWLNEYTEGIERPEDWSRVGQTVTQKRTEKKKKKKRKRRQQQQQRLTLWNKGPTPKSRMNWWPRRNGRLVR